MITFFTVMFLGVHAGSCRFFRQAMKKMKHEKSTGTNNIIIEMLEALEDFGIEAVTKILNNIYNTVKIPSDFLKLVFIAVPMKPGAIECELHGIISPVSHFIKILLHIIMLRSRNKIRPEIAEEQCGFVDGKGTANEI